MFTTTHIPRGRLRLGRLHHGVAVLAAIAVAASVTPAAQAADHTPPITAKLPVVKHYKVEALGFTATDESGWDGDWYAPVSDEPYFVLSSVGLPGTSATLRSQEFSDVDSGESRTFNPPLAIFPQHGGSGAAPNGIGLSVQLWEADAAGASGTVKATAKYFRQAGAIGSLVDAPGWVATTLGVMASAADYIGSALEDDLLGSQTFAYDTSTLNSRLPTAGSSFLQDKWIGSPDDADYHLLLRVTRTS
jgi:hypothetical protein